MFTERLVQIKCRYLHTRDFPLQSAVKVAPSAVRPNLNQSMPKLWFNDNNKKLFDAMAFYLTKTN